MTDCSYVVNRASSSLPQNTSEALFVVSGGRVLVDLLVGRVEVAVTGGDPCALAVYENTSRLSPDITTMGLSSVPPGNLFGDFSLGYWATLPSEQFLLQDGQEIRIVTSDVSTGEVSFTLSYRPLDPGAVVTAV